MWSNLVSNPRRGFRLLGLFIIMFGIGALMLPSLGKMDARGVSIFDLQFMRTSENAVGQVARLGPSGVDAAQMAHYLDFAFLLAYGIALSAACVVLAARLADRGRARLAARGTPVAWFAVVGAGLDALQNVAILLVLDGQTGQPWPAAAFGFAAVKFGLLAVVIVYLVVAVARLAERVDVAAD
jgi:hypothetical protein